MTKRFLLVCTIAALVTMILVATATARSGVTFQGQASNAQLSDGEQKALNAVNAAAGAAAKLTAATTFVEKFPKSKARLQVVGLVAEEIARVPAATEAIALGEKAQSVFTGAGEQDMIKPVLLGAYARGNRIDEAFKLAADLLAKKPDDIYLLVQLTNAGTEEAKQKIVKNASQSLQYGAKAIELIEANKKPESMDEATWANYKTLLPQLYQQTAVLNLVTGNNAEAKARLQKATSLGSKDPYPYALLGWITNEEYTKSVPGYQALAEGPAKQEAMKALAALLDSIVDLYAHAAALATGRTEYQELMKQVIPDLTSYYKFRHNQSTEGLQQLIDKYKPQP